MDPQIAAQLKPWRDKIDQVDDQIIDLLAQRQAAVEEVGSVKEKNRAQVYDPKRELQARMRRKKLTKERGLDQLQVEMIFEQIVMMARESQKNMRQKTEEGEVEAPKDRPVRMGIMGGIGSFSEAATLQFLEKHSMKNYELHYPISTENVLKALETDEVDIGIFPIENSTAGLVMESIKASSKHLFDIEEIFEFDVIQCLMALPGVKKSDIRKVMSHPQALRQCVGYLEKNFPQAELIEGTDTAEGARLLEESPEETHLAVIAPKRCAQLYHLEILEEAIQDQKKNFTRFIAAKKSS
ncbi:MAG: prephenate dehydratase domain-containing protein [bacterium]|nr:prephenate dehydratase domain-containing protein [bacterium]